MRSEDIRGDAEGLAQENGGVSGTALCPLRVLKTQGPKQLPSPCYLIMSNYVFLAHRK